VFEVQFVDSVSQIFDPRRQPHIRVYAFPTTRRCSHDLEQKDIMAIQCVAVAWRTVACTRPSNLAPCLQLAFSPFFENKVACASAANFGIVGNGRLWILNHGAAPMVPPRPGMAPPPGGIMPERTFDTQDGLFDVAWSEMHENQLVTSSGDGSIKLWDLTLPVGLVTIAGV